MPNHLDLPGGGLEEAIAGCIGVRHELLYPGSSPPLGREDVLCAVSDYKGRYGDHPYSQIGLLLTSARELSAWLQRMAEIRTLRRFDRTMQYKSLRDKITSGNLREWLKAAGMITGVLVFFEIEDGLALMPEHYKPRGLKAHVAEEAARAVCLVGLARACFARRESDLVWVTDDDDIAPNPRQLVELRNYARGICDAYLPLGSLEVLRASESARGQDLVSLPDLVVGAVAEASNQLSKSGKSLEAWVGDALPDRAKAVLEWWCSSKVLQTRYVRISKGSPHPQVVAVRLTSSRLA